MTKQQQFTILNTENALLSSDFSKTYPPAMAENSKFVQADLSDPMFADYPEGGYGKYVQLAYVLPSLDAVDFSKSYSPAIAENGKFVELTLDESVGWPSTNYPKYAVLTYLVNANELQTPESAESTPTTITSINSSIVFTPENGPLQSWTATENTTSVIFSGWDVSQFGQITIEAFELDSYTHDGFTTEFWIGDAPTFSSKMIIELVSVTGSLSAKGISLDLT